MPLRTVLNPPFANQWNSERYFFSLLRLLFLLLEFADVSGVRSRAPLRWSRRIFCSNSIFKSQLLMLLNLLSNGFVIRVGVDSFKIFIATNGVKEWMQCGTWRNNFIYSMYARKYYSRVLWYVVLKHGEQRKGKSIQHSEYMTNFCFCSTTLSPDNFWLFLPFFFLFFSYSFCDIVFSVSLHVKKCSPQFRCIVRNKKRVSAS